MSRRTMAWGELIAGCKVHGKERMLAVMQAETRSLEGLQAHLYGGDYDEQHGAGRMTAGILGRLETIIRLKSMTDAEMDRLWAQATPRQQKRLLAQWQPAQQNTPDRARAEGVSAGHAG
jgi:hypothetical protein